MEKILIVVVILVGIIASSINSSIVEENQGIDDTVAVEEHQ